MSLSANAPNDVARVKERGYPPSIKSISITKIPAWGDREKELYFEGEGELRVEKKRVNVVRVFCVCIKYFSHFLTGSKASMVFFVEG